MLASAGVLSSDAVALSFLIYLNRVFIGIFGGVVQMLRRGDKLGTVRQISRKPLEQIMSPEMKE
jgi:hypothetical protein